MADTTPVTRFAPSPTGMLHVGAYRTALYNWLYARQHQGQFILRIEDTDRERSDEAFEHNIHESLDWLQMEPDQIYRQSDHHERHTQLLQHLIDTDAAYVSQESGGKGERAHVIRFRNPNKEVTFSDQIRGEVTFDTSDLGDFVIAKSMDEPLFHLAVVADDYDEGVTHVIRGEDHISNTPRQILIQEAIGAPRPTYAHIPLILAPDKGKLSKRKGARAITEYRDEGFLPGAVMNFMALLGWNPGTDEEIFTPAELVDRFSIERVHKSGAVFDEQKFRHINREHLKRLDTSRIRDYVLPYLKQAEPITSGRWDLTDEMIDRMLPLLIERIEVFDDARHMLESGELDFLFEAPQFTDGSILVGKDSDETEAATHLETVRQMIAEIDESSFTSNTVKDVIWDYASEWGRGRVLWPLRVALSGKEKSPDPFTLAAMLGKEETLSRINQAQDMLS